MKETQKQEFALPCPNCRDGILLDQGADTSRLDHIPVRCSDCGFEGRRLNTAVFAATYGPCITPP